MNKKEMVPFAATHPGELIKDELKSRKMTQRELATKTGLKTSVISETINGKRPISLNTALKLESVFEISASYWLNLQTQYELDKEHIEKKPAFTETVSMVIPTKDRGLLKKLAGKYGWACLF
ncbi:MAG: HigA family addiction module antidote protein [Bacteroidales bacterium]|nr:HigA family addiction module antidote protein [Bacteroidales bacterium]